MKKKLSLASSLISTEIDGETILLDIESENYFGFDSVGSDIWRLLKKGKTLQQVYDSLLEMYEVDPKMLRTDLLEFVDKLAESGLVKIE